MQQDQPMFLGLVYRLREAQVPVGTSEVLALADALRANVHQHSALGFYHAARCILIHHEAHYDAFDAAFIAEFGGNEDRWQQLLADLEQWLDDPLARPDDRLTNDMSLDELRKELEKRLEEQTERHDGGDYWVGSGGRSPFGHSGAPQPGIRIGNVSGGRSALQTADARAYRGYRGDVTLDIRQLEVALRRLRSFVREGGEPELDVQATIDATAANAGELEIVTRPPERPDTHVLLLVDVGGSMYPYADLMSKLFSAAKKATHFKQLQTYYFHNCAYQKVYETEGFTEPVWLVDVLRKCDQRYKVIMVGDALMAPYELHAPAAGGPAGGSPESGFASFARIAEHFPDRVWLNPEPETRWGGTTIDDIAQLFPMFPLTLDGLGEAMRLLNKGVPSRA